MSARIHIRSHRLTHLALSLVLASLAITSSASANKKPLEASANTRVRLGLEAGVGGVLGDSEGGAFTFSGQLGLQANDIFAIYWKPTLMADGWAAASELDLDVYLFTSQLGMIDFTASRYFQIGVGGGVDIGRFGVCDDSRCVMQSREVRPAVEGRMAFIIPLPGVRARWGIPLTFTAHLTFLDDGNQIYSLTGGPGILRF